MVPTNFNMYSKAIDLNLPSTEKAPALPNNSQENIFSEGITGSSSTGCISEKVDSLRSSVPNESVKIALKPITGSNSVKFNYLFPYVKSFAKWGALWWGAKLTGAVSSLALTSKNICLGSYVPNYVAKTIGQSKYLFETINNTLTPHNYDLYSVLIAPALEEFMCRLLIQELLLKKMPKMVMAKTSKDYVHLVDSKIAKIARVLISSAIFGLLHYTSSSELANVTELQLCFYSNRMLNSFVTGLVYGSLQERTGNVAFSILAHTLTNSLTVGSMDALRRTAG